MKYVLGVLLLILLAIDAMTRVWVPDPQRDTRSGVNELNERFEPMDFSDSTFEYDFFGKIEDSGKEKSETENKNEPEPTPLEKLSVSLVATYLQAQAFALIEVRDKNAEKVGQYQKIKQGDVIDGFTVQTISSNMIVLIRDDKEVTIKVFERS